MEHTIDSFIEELQNISKEKRKLPLKVKCPNGLLVSPKVKMLFSGTANMFSDQPNNMIITWDD